jgi:hypothetical protein
VFAWTVGVSLVLMLLLIWSALYRGSLRSTIAHAGRCSVQPGRTTAEASPERGADWGAPDPAASASGPGEPTALVEAGAPDTATSGAERAARHAAGK